MTNEERREKLAEIFGQQAEYFEDWFGPDDFDERDAAVAKKIGKPLSKVTLGEVLEAYTMYVMLCDLLDLGEE